MDIARTDGLDERLIRLEVENSQIRRRMNRLKAVVGALALALLIPMAMGAFQQVPDQVVARRFFVLDPQTNKVRIALMVNNNGSAVIDVNDIEGKRHIQLQSGFGGEGSGLFIMDPNGQVIKTVP